MWNLLLKKKWNKCTYLQNRNRPTDIGEKTTTYGYQKAKVVVGVVTEEFELSYTLWSIK